MKIPDKPCDCLSCKVKKGLAILEKLSIEDGFKHTQCPDCRSYHLGICPFCAGWEPMPPNRGAG